MDDLLIKYLMQECIPEEEARVQAWIQQDAANQKRYDGFVWLWQESKSIGANITVDVDNAWQQFVTLRNAGGSKETPVVSIASNRRRWLMVAASAIVLLAAAWLYKLVLPSEPIAPAIVMLEWKTTNNTLIDTLPDGSVVTLNKNSSLRYPSAFTDSTRNISLDGEAFFDVAADKAHPFIIAASDVEVRVVGTSFNVRSRKGVTKVVVETGVVQVRHQKKMVSLQPKEQVTVRSGDTVLQKQNTSDQLYQYFRSKVFVCDDTPLPTLVQALNEAYDVNIIIGKASLNNLRINTTFNNESIDTVLLIIAETMGIETVRSGSTIILR